MLYLGFDLSLHISTFMDRRIIYVCEQRTLWRVCAYTQFRMGIRCSIMCFMLASNCIIAINPRLFELCQSGSAKYQQRPNKFGKFCVIPLFHTGPESQELPRIYKYLDLNYSKLWPQIPRFEKSCLIRKKFLMHSWIS